MSIEDNADRRQTTQGTSGTFGALLSIHLTNTISRGIELRFRIVSPRDVLVRKIPATSIALCITDGRYGIAMA